MTERSNIDEEFREILHRLEKKIDMVIGLCILFKSDYKTQIQELTNKIPNLDREIFQIIETTNRKALEKVQEEFKEEFKEPEESRKKRFIESLKNASEIVDEKKLPRWRANRKQPLEDDLDDLYDYLKTLRHHPNGIGYDDRQKLFIFEGSQHWQELL